ncbi:membrane lipoprotein lipid attachment site-containing protein [Sporosarcina sp. ZBG7A]|uniref:membrane lipoprotein lipid attachment site-containing protein n=1 Tax=Sporosarcina sp. ZBG7A TaxID=1582223 RepID=UPI00057B3132|nr:membrane lipoprotein lipid attachment site-containing protein [Sporosarcina sp. ZBG7A]
MKKAFILLVAGLMLAACNNDDKSENASDTDKKSAATESQEQAGSETADDQVGLEEGLKADSTEVEYEDIAKGDVPANTKVTFKGTVFAVEDGRFGLKKDVTDSTEDVLWVDDIRLGERTEIPNGTTVTVYGSYTDTDEQDVPKMRAVFIDQK